MIDKWWCVVHWSKDRESGDEESRGWDRMVDAEEHDAIAAKLAQVQDLAPKAEWFLNDYLEMAGKTHPLEFPGCHGLFAAELKKILRAVADTAK